jgi:hypothetical protein
VIKHLAFILLATAAVSAAPASAQVTPLNPTTNAVRVTFTGTVTNDVTNTIRIRQPDGSSIPYTGPVPDYPYKKGDQVTISFDTVLPNRNFYASPSYTGQQAADGIYRVAVTSPFSGSASNLGSTKGIDVSGVSDRKVFRRQGHWT